MVPLLLWVTCDYLTSRDNSSHDSSSNDNSPHANVTQKPSLNLELGFLFSN
ncbi:hypothetical protein VCR4J2_240136 [Vibrio coralliirubri]|nr:hypothetical protein VCR4J2_240136 [Vibrio coralliirubri]